MKLSIKLPLACLLVCGIYSCGDSDVDAKESMTDAMKTATEDMTPDAIKAMVPDLVKDSVAELGKIKDLASAETVATAVTPLLDKLKEAKGMAGFEMPDMTALSGIATTLTTKFASDPKIMAVIQPILDQIKGLMG